MKKQTIALGLFLFCVMSCIVIFILSPDGGEMTVPLFITFFLVGVVSFYIYLNELEKDSDKSQISDEYDELVDKAKDYYKSL